MNLTVNQLLTIVGRLDDSPGFDTPRERFRRFLTERITDAQSARLIIQQCLQMAGEQNHRALQDAVVLTGKFLGFGTAFGSYQHDAGSALVSGEWESRRRLRVILSLCAGQIGAAELDALSTVIRNDSNPKETGMPRVGLCIVTPFYAAKTRLEEQFRDHTHPDLRLISLGGILRMVDMMAGGHLTHEDVLRVLNPDVLLDSALDLLDRSAPNAAPVFERAPSEMRVPDVQPAMAGYWIASVRLDAHTPPEPFVASVIGKRRLLAINAAAQPQRVAQPGDSIAIFIVGVGFVADARVSGFITDGTQVVRETERYAQVLRLSDVTVYDAARIPAPDLARRLEQRLNDDGGAILTPVSRHEFELMTRAAVPSAIR